MSNKNTLAHAADAIMAMEKTLEASTGRVEAKLTAFSEVVRNTRRKMASPGGFDWATHRTYKVVSINDTHIKAAVGKTREGTPITVDIPRADLSLSTWQVTSIIRRTSASQRNAALRNATDQHRKNLAQARKDLTLAQKCLQQSEEAHAKAQESVERDRERMRAVEKKRQAARARRATAKSAPQTAVTVAQ